jgi:putative ABC transport system permease protein
VTIRPRLLRRLLSLFSTSRRDREMTDEMAFHIESTTDALVRSGLAEPDARLAARRQFGGILKQKETGHEIRTGQLLEDLHHDLRYMGRSLRRSPGFALAVVLMLALGIGANTAVFSVIDSVLLKPLPYPGADRIVALRAEFRERGETQTLISIANFRDWRDRSSTFEAMASYRPGENSVSIGGTAEYGRIASIDAQFFRVFAVQPIIGRTFRPDEVGPSAPLQALISHAYWQSRLGADPRILGRTIRVANTARSIIGVLPPGFRFPEETDVWIPQTTTSTNRAGHSVFAVGRLKPGVSLEQGQADLATVAASLEVEYPDSNKGRGVAVVPLQEELVGDVRLTLYLLWGLVGIVLLIACANTATLLLGKAAARTREIAVRAALGASRRRIIRQLITESAMLAAIAGVSGLVLAYWGTKLLIVLMPADLVRLAHPAIDIRVLVFTLFVSMATSVLFGFIPAFHAAGVDLIESLRRGGTRSVAGGAAVRTRGVLVVFEIALAVVLLAGAGLLIKSLVALHNVELGFKPSNALVMKATGVRSRDENNAYFGALFSRVAALSGVVAVGATSIPPGDLSLAGSGTYFIDLDRIPETRDRASDPSVFLSIVAPGTFAALGIPLKAGRDFNDGDTGDRPLVAIVNEALVRRSLAGQDPIGRKIICPFDRPEAMTIVGVVGDVRQRNPAVEPLPECYMPYLQHSYNSNTLNVVVRTAGDPLAIAGTLRRVSAEISPEVPVSFSTMEAAVSEGVEDSTFRTALFALFAALAVGLAMAGVYGVMAYAVEQRSREIGVRMALGANKASVLRLILGQGLALTVAGLTLGLAGAIAAARLLETVLFEVRPIDVEVYLAVIALIALVTMLAGYLPAWRAAVLNPVDALKAE